MKTTPLILAAALLACATEKAVVPAPSPAPAPVAAAPTPPAPTARPAAQPVPPKLRLGDAVQPVRYAAELTLVPTADTFQGVIDIELSSREPLQVLWLNGNDLTLRKAEAKVGGKVIPGTPVRAPKDFVGVVFDPPLPQGASTVRIEYEGVLASKESDGVTRQQVDGTWYVFTQFEPIDARRAFPCFDEPSFKVPWQLTLRTKKGDLAFTNTPLLSATEGEDGFVTHRFAQTQPLPSYLIAFAAGPFERVDAGKAGQKGTPMGIIVPRGMSDRARYAKEVTGPLMERLEQYFGMPYPYEKMDFIAVPYFGGAMEHPGLITYSLPGILSRPEEETISFQRRYAGTATHELAHQWFGDLVTTAWWDDLWLNEAFATWMTPKMLEGWRPSWGIPEERVNNRSNAANADSLVSARKIRQPIVSNDDMTNAFDGITYGKGAAVISMFERWVGAETFQKAVQRYMREHAHGNATAADFLGAISAEAGRDVAPVFATFLDQAGVPLVKASLRCDAGAPPRLELSQRRYLPEGSSGTPGWENQRWQIPVCVRWGKGKAEGRACTLLAEEKGTLALESNGCPDWVLPNDQMAGYYRMQPEGELLGKLLSKARLTTPEKVGVLGDLGALVRAGKLPYADVLRYVPAFAQDRSRHVVQATLNIVGGLHGQGLVPASQRAAYAAFLRDTYGKQARALGVTEKPGEDEDTRLLRASMIPLLATDGEDKQLAAQARALADRYLVDRKAVSPDMVGPVLRVAAYHGGRAFFEKLRDAASKEKDQVHRRRLFAAMSDSSDPAVLKEALALTLSDKFDPRETVFPIVFGSLEEPAHRGLVYGFVRENFDQLVERLPRDVGGNLAHVGSALCDESKRKEVEAFFGERAARFTGGPRKLAQALERMRLCATFRQSQGPSVEQFLQSTTHKPGMVGPK